MPEPRAKSGRRLRHPVKPAAVVFSAAAAYVALLAAIALFQILTAPLPPVQYGPFDDPRALTGSVALIVLFTALGVRTLRGLSARALVSTLTLLIAAAPLAWGVAFLDSLGPDLINSSRSARAFAGWVLFDGSIYISTVGVIAAFAEVIRIATARARLKLT